MPKSVEPIEHAFYLLKQKLKVEKLHKCCIYAKHLKRENTAFGKIHGSRFRARICIQVLKMMLIFINHVSLPN